MGTLPSWRGHPDKKSVLKVEGNRDPSVVCHRKVPVTVGEDMVVPSDAYTQSQGLYGETLKIIKSIKFKSVEIKQTHLIETVCNSHIR